MRHKVSYSTFFRRKSLSKAFTCYACIVGFFRAQQNQIQFQCSKEDVVATSIYICTVFFWVKLAFEFRGNTVVKNQLRVNSSTNGRPNSTNIIFHLFCGKLNYTFVLESQSSINSATHNTVNNNLVFVENQLSINSSTIQWKIFFH